MRELVSGNDLIEITRNSYLFLIISCRELCGCRLYYLLYCRVMSRFPTKLLL